MRGFESLILCQNKNAIPVGMAFLFCPDWDSNPFQSRLPVAAWPPALRWRNLNFLQSRKCKSNPSSSPDTRHSLRHRGCVLKRHLRHPGKCKSNPSSSPDTRHHPPASGLCFKEAFTASRKMQIESLILPGYTPPPGTGAADKMKAGLYPGFCTAE